MGLLTLLESRTHREIVNPPVPPANLGTALWEQMQREQEWRERERKRRELQDEEELLLLI